MKRTFLVAAVFFGSCRLAFGYGETDPSFNPPAVPGWTCDSYALATPADGSAFLVGLTPDTGQEAAILKFRADGSPDPTWGVGGVSRIWNVDSSKILLPTPQGGLYVLGSKFNRLLSNGNFDTTFAFDNPLNTRAVSAAVTEDGGLAYLGLAAIPTVPGSQFFFRVLDRNGVTKSFREPVTTSGEVYAWSIDSQGTLQIGTYVILGGNVVPTLTELSYSDLAGASSSLVTRTLSPSQLLPKAGNASWMSPAVGVDAEGGVIFPRVSPSDASLSLVRYGPDGHADTAFAAAGSASIPAMTFSFPGLPAISPKAIWRSPGGGWTVVADLTKSLGGFVGDQFFVVVRFLADGTPDPSFPQNSTLDDRQNYARLDSGALLHSAFNPRSCKLARQLTDDVRVEATMVEYYHPALDHYFMTLDGFEAALLDDNVSSLGWVRTGRTFGAWHPVDLPGATKACRFYGDPVIGPNSHFYSTDQSECDGLRAIELNTPPGVPAWHLEGYPFSVTNAVNAQCPANLSPVYRAFSGPAAPATDPHHRYFTDPILYAQVVASGWDAEGTRFCVPPRPSRTLY
jgi:Domain of unknown function (DUF5122) beta-propeller